MPIIAQLSDAAQKALDRQQAWTAADLVKIAVGVIVCIGGGFLVDSALGWLIAKKPLSDRKSQPY